jgi:hypothetical protein
LVCDVLVGGMAGGGGGGGGGGGIPNARYCFRHMACI